ncbi:hypothetical protein [Nostoc sp. C117]
MVITYRRKQDRTYPSAMNEVNTSFSPTPFFLRGDGLFGTK